MMYDRIKSVITLFSLILFFPTIIFAQVLIQKNLTVEDGLVYSQVLCAYPDREGYLWFGTSSGISRWDGRRFYNFHSTEKIRFDNVKLITESEQGSLIIVTRYMVLIYEKGEFVKAENMPVELESWIEQAVKLKDGLIYLTDQDSGLWQYDGQVFKNISPRPLHRDLKITSMLLTNNNSLLIGSRLNGLFTLDGKKLTPASLMADIKPNSISWLHQNSGDTLFIATRGNGLFYCTHLYKGQIECIEGLPGLVINHIFEDSDGRLYLATDKGVAVISRGKVIKTITRKNGLANNFVWYSTADKQGNIYFCTDGGGVSQYRPDVYETYNKDSGLPDNTVWCIRETKEGHYYFATDQGVAVLEDGKFRTINTQQGLTDNMVITIHKAKNGRLFFGTSDHGVDIMNHGRIRNINTSNGLTSNFVWSITEDVAGRIYLATYDGGICILENDHIIDTLNTEDGLTNDYLISAYCDPNGILYFGLDNGGVFQVENGRLISQKALLPGLTIWAIHVNEAGNIYFGTDKNGLIIKNSEAGYDTITIRDGLSHNSILGIMEDEKGRLYLTTDNGLNILDLSKGKPHIRLITGDDGLASRECNQGAYFKDSKGRLWIGTIRGVTCYNPAADKPVLVAPPVNIIGLRVFDRDIRLTSDHIDKPFEYHENYLQFNFVGLDLRSPHKLKYRYRLDNAQGEWIHTDYPQVQFANLKADHYRFEVQAGNEWGNWSETAGLSFTILPPFWATWWFRSGIALILLALTAILIYFRMRQLLAVERIRAKIAADLHDDIGAGLSEINILSAVAETKTPEPAKQYVANELNRIAKVARQLIDSMSDIVWFVNPQKDSMTDLVSRLKDIFSDILDAKDIDFHSENMHLLQKIKLDMEKRQFIFMIFKEALNNALKYSDCSKIDFMVSYDKNRLKITLQDNGKGFNSQLSKQNGNGLANMKQRALKINGILDIESKPDQGTKISFSGKV
jgi:ligand-binding sensor domain-containing protein/two-component sensor histidine kinase